MATRAEQKELRKQQILEVALELFIKKGYVATKIEDIAKTANMSVGLLFHYFESKEQLYMELINIGVSSPTDMMSGLFNCTPLELFQSFAENIIGFVQQNKFTANMFVFMGKAYYDQSTPEKARKLAEKLDFYHLTVPKIVEGQNEGVFKEGDPLALSTLFWSSMQGAVASYAISDMPLPKPEWLMDIILK